MENQEDTNIMTTWLLKLPLKRKHITKMIQIIQIQHQNLVGEEEEEQEGEQEVDIIFYVCFYKCLVLFKFREFRKLFFSI